MLVNSIRTLKLAGLENSLLSAVSGKEDLVPTDS